MKKHNQFLIPSFTLIELMIVVAIIMFLAVLAVPQLFRYKAKAYQAEVAMNLASLHTAQQAYFAQHGSYTTILNGENGLGWRPAGYQADGSHSFYYTYGFNVSDGQEGVHYFTGKLQTPCEQLEDTGIDNTTFKAGAAGAVLNNTKCDVWTITETRLLKNTQNGID